MQDMHETAKRIASELHTKIRKGEIRELADRLDRMAAEVMSAGYQQAHATLTFEKVLGMRDAVTCTTGNSYIPWLNLDPVV